ncbi:MAG: SpoIVB peptidase [Clostridiaceae bacterium]|nr:SpoIVB peptidase [Clostridiaceae bacterium]
MLKKILRPKFIIFVLILMALVSYTITLFIIPGSITILAGEDYKISFKSPLLIQIHSQSNILKVSDSHDSPISAFEKPYTLMATEEGNAKIGLSMLGIIPVKTVEVRSIESQKVFASGAPIGIKLKTNGIVIINVSGVFLDDGTKAIPAENAGLLTGDVLIKAGGKDLKNISDLTDVIKNSGGKPVDIIYRRQDIEYKGTITPIKSGEDEEYRIGVWVRDSSAGIGTLTFINQANNVYGALGHGINDIDTGSLLQVGSGSLMESNIKGIKKGIKGAPGELEGDFLNNSDIVGDIKLNCEFGIFGKIDNKIKKEKLGRLYSIGPHSAVTLGRATILTCINGNQVEEYEIEIQRIARNDLNSTKNMILQITDPRLLNSTGGIVQGMSGSPIIQDGRLIGAVTHVFINDPMRGYGVFIESMLSKAEAIDKRK